METPTSSSSRILIVEDNETNRFVIVSMLRRGGHVPLIARDGVEGVEAALAERPRLILMDIAMPRMSGLEAVKEIRRRLPDAEMTIIAVTADATEAGRAACEAAGFDDLIVKPINLPGLLEKVGRVIGHGEGA